MYKTSIAVIGGGPAGLSAAIEAAKAGAQVVLIDENSRPGGQLFKQIHKFFGSKEHKAGVRGIDIGKQLLKEAQELGIEVWLNTEVCGIEQNKLLWAVKNKTESVQLLSERIVLATGAMENSIHFPGWTLPGVMGAGAAQTFINIHRVAPGKKVLMIGSGNVGVIVSYQLLQAGCEVTAIVEASPRLGGYGVHTAKVCRAGVPFYTSHTILRALGENKVEGAVIGRLNDKWEFIPGTEKVFEVDTICIATGLTPLAELAWIAGCKFKYIPELGGFVPLHDENMETTIQGIYVAGDITGIEEASSAMEEGRLAGINAAASLGFYSSKQKEKLCNEVRERLDALRQGPFGKMRRIKKQELITSRREIRCHQQQIV
ncbi:MAG: hypothetical protein PWQ82_380 [Thermosediminibacterales bacterium]|nr:hypothetical protein [Thermosediminibacterales bacterium]MDK2836681.1 hypothetical protein [Thermosediminibacterales bacterium]